ncbi:MAG TPA: GNAT family N-acetyltransferase [Anaerolineaceae bacterium]
MLHELPFEQYGQAAPLFAPMDNHLALRSLLEGKTRARLFVDDPARPRLALAWLHNQRFFLLGEPGAGQADVLRTFFYETVLPWGRAEGKELALIYYAPAAWEPLLAAALAEQHPLPEARQYYRFDLAETGGLPEWQDLPPGFTLRPVDATLLADPGLSGLDLLREEMCSERESVEDFLRWSFGLALFHGSNLAGWCLSEYNADARCEIGIATLPPHQRRGLATLMTRRLLEMARERGMRSVGWDCLTRNLPSAATALKAGFRKIEDYSVLLVWYALAEAIAVQGSICLRRGKYDQALDWFERAFAVQDEAPRKPAWAYWLAGCAAARLGKSAAALAYLEQAARAGALDANDLATCEHLASLRGLAEFQELLGRAEK